MKRNHKQIKTIMALVVIGLLAAAQTSCSAINSLADAGRQESQTIYLASVGPQDYIKDTGFQEGMELALAEINQKGLLNGKTRLQIDSLDDKDDLTTGMKIAQQVVEDGRYLAVIGHWSAAVALPTAAVYEKGKTLVLSPAVSNVRLTREASTYIFRMVPSDQDEIDKIMETIRNEGYDRLAICYADTEYGRGLTGLLTQACKNSKIIITDIHSSFVNQAEFDRQYQKWQALDTDAVFIADALPGGDEVVRQVRSRSESLPVLSAGGFSFGDINALTDGKAGSVSYVDPYYHNQDQAGIQQFNTRYREKFAKDPGQLSIDGYDIITCLAAAIEKAGTADSAAVAGVLKSAPGWQGTDGSFHFDRHGNLVGRELTLVELQQGKYRYIKEKG